MPFLHPTISISFGIYLRLQTRSPLSHTPSLGRSLFRCFFLMIWLNDILSGILDKINNKRNSTENGNIKRTAAGECWNCAAPVVRTIHFLTLDFMLSCIFMVVDDRPIRRAMPAQCVCVPELSTLAKGKRSHWAGALAFIRDRCSGVFHYTISLLNSIWFDFMTSTTHKFRLFAEANRCSIWRNIYLSRKINKRQCRTPMLHSDPFGIDFLILPH